MGNEGIGLGQVGCEEGKIGDGQMEDFQLLTPKQVAKLFGVTEVCIYQWARRGVLPHLKIEKCVRFSIDDLKSFLEERRVAGRRR